MSISRGIAFDSTNNRLYAADYNNNRVVVYDTTTITNGENAVDLLGQYNTYSSSDFTPVYDKANANSAPNAIGVSSPYGLAFDGINRRLFVLDNANNRVLVYNLTSGNLLVDHIADNVIGQANFYTASAASTQPGFSGARDLAFDATNNRLYVVDSDNNRVTVYNTSTITNGMNAMNVLGQTTFSGVGAATTQPGLRYPFGVAVDTSNNRVYVSSDLFTHRVTVYDTTTITNGENAVNVLGQTAFDATAAATTQAGLSNPENLAVDATNNRLYVGDRSNNRVIVYDVSAITNGESAVNVLGQTSFTTATSATTQPGLATPFGLVIDSTNNRLYVGAQASNRVTVYDTTTITNGENAVNVLGQTAFDATAAATTQKGLSSLQGLALDTTNSRLYVADTGNNRIVAYDVAPPPTISGVVYSDEGTTPLTSKTIAVSINGAAAAATTTSDATTGAYSLTATISAGDVLTLYIDGATEDAVTVTKATGGNQTAVNLYQDRLITRCDNASCSLTNTNLDTADNNADADISGIYAVASSNLTLASGKHLFIPTSHTFAPGGNITLTGNFTNNGTYTKGTETININSTSASATLKTNGSQLYNLTQNGTAGTYTLQDALSVSNNLTITAGTLDTKLSSNYGVTVGGTWSRSGTFTPRSGTLTLTGTSTFADTMSFYAVTVNGSSQTVTLGAALTLTNTLTITAGTLNTSGTNYALTAANVSIGASGTLNVQASTVTLNGTSGTLLTNSGTFTSGTSTVLIKPDAAITVLSGSFTGSNAFYNLTLSPVISADRTYSLGTALATNGNFTSSPTGGEEEFSWRLTVQMGGSLTIASTKLLSLQGSFLGAGTTLDTSSASNYAITTGAISLASGGTLTANASVITLTATSDGLFVGQGTFTQGTSEVIVASASGSPYLLTIYPVTFHKLTINSTATVVSSGLAAVTINNASGAALTVTAGVFNIQGSFTGPGAGNGTLTISSGATLCIGGTSLATTATCDSGATSTTALDMPTFQTYSFNADSTVSYLADAAQTISVTPTYGNLKFTPKLTSGRTYTFASGTATINGDFTSNPNGGGTARTLTVTMAGAMTMPASKTATLTGASSGVTSMNTVSGSNYAITSGFLNIASGSTLTAQGSTITLAGTSGTLFTKAGTFTAGTSTVVFSGNGSATLNSAAITFSAITSSGTGTKTLGADITTGGTLTISAGTFDVSASNYAVSVGGNFSNAGTFTARSGTVTLTSTSSSATLTSGGSSFYNLTQNGSGGTYTLQDALTTTNNLTITAGTLDTKLSSNYGVTVGGNFSNAGTYTPRSNTTTLTGTGTQTLTSGGTSFNILTINGIGGTYTLQDALDVNSNLTITAGTLADGGFAITIGGNWSNAGSYTGTGTVTFDASSGTQTLTSGGTGTNQDFQNVTKTTGGTLQFATNSVDIDGTLTIAASTIVDINALNLTANTLVNNGTLLADGSETITITTKDTDSGAIKYDGSGSYTTALSYGNTYYDVEFAGTGVWEPSAAVTINRNLTITSGTFDIDGQNLTVTGTFSNIGTLRLLGTETLSLTPDTDSGTISYDNASALTDFPSPLNDTYYNLTLAGSGTVTLAANVTTNNNLTIASGATLAFNGYDASIVGNFVNSGTASGTSTRTITLSGTTQTFTPTAITVGSLLLTGSSGTVSLGSNFTLSDLLSIAAGRVLSLLSYTLTASSTPITNLGTINEGTGAIIRSSSNLYIADSNFDEDAAISLAVDSIYISIIDEDGNLNGASADTLSGVVVSCPTDSETVTLTETGAATETFRNAGLTTALYAGSNTNNNGTLTCANGVTITATYTDPQDGTDTRSDTATATSDTVPTAPSSFAGTAPSSTSITWTWTDNSSTETGFKLYNSSNTLIATISTANTTSYTETGLTKGVSYTRKLAAYNAAGNSSYSGSASVTTPAEPTAPSSFAGTAASNTSITWTWTDNSSDETGFKLLDSAGTTIATIATANTATYTETGLTKNTSYTRKIVAYNSDGTSTASSTATVTTSNNSPTAFSLVSPADGALSNTGLPTFSFKKSSETGGSIASYTLYVGDISFTGIPANGNAASNPVSKTDYENTYTAQYFSEDDGNTTNDYIVVTLKDGSTSLPLNDGKYVWYVRAIDAEGASTISEDRTITIDATKPTISGATNISTSNTKPTITFTANDTYGLKELTVTLEQAKTSLSAITSYVALQTTTYTLTGKSQQISFTPKNTLAAGKYRYKIVLTDVTGHETTNTFTLTILSAAQQASEAIAQLDAQTDTPTTIIATLRDLLPDTPLNIPALQEKAVVRRQAQAENFATFLGRIRYRNIPGAAQMEQLLARMFTNINHAIAQVTTGIDIPEIRFALPSQFTQIATFFTSGRDTRVRQGLAHRQAITASLERVFAPVRSVGSNLALRVRATYEVWIDRTPTKISNLAMTNIGPTEVTINWDTNHLTRTGKVNYGTSTQYTEEKFEEDGLRDRHSVTLNNLDPNTTYYFEVMNQNGGYVYDAYYTVTTLAAEGEQVSDTFIPQTAIVQGEKPVPVYKEPTPTAEVIKTLLPEARLRALTEKDGWISVLLLSGQEVWVQKEHIQLIPQEGESASAQH